MALLSAPILTLNIDTFLAICRWLEDDIRDLLCLRRTCRRMLTLTKLRSCWWSALQDLGTHVPIPHQHAQSLSALDDTELENLVIRIFRLDLNWNHFSPAPTNVRVLVPSSNPSRFTSLNLLPGGRFLVCATDEGPIMCYDLESDRSPLIVGRWESDEVPWILSRIKCIQSRFETSGSSQVIVTGLFDVEDPEFVDVDHSSIGIWNFDCIDWPISESPSPPKVILNFTDQIGYMSLNDQFLACATSNRIHVIDYPPSSSGSVHQGIFHVFRDIQEIKMLASHILVAFEMKVYLFELPELHETSSVNNIEECRSSVRCIWNWSLNAGQLGLFRSSSWPDDSTAITREQTSDFTISQPFFILTSRNMFTMICSEPDSTPGSLGTLQVLGTRLPQGLQDMTSLASIGPCGKRGVWFHPDEAGSRWTLQLIDFWYRGQGAQTWLPSSPHLKRLDEKAGHVESLPSFETPVSFAWDESIGRICTSSDSLVVYDFAP